MVIKTEEENFGVYVSFEGLSDGRGREDGCLYDSQAIGWTNLWWATCGELKIRLWNMFLMVSLLQEPVSLT